MNRGTQPSGSSVNDGQADSTQEAAHGHYRDRAGDGADTLCRRSGLSGRFRPTHSPPAGTGARYIDRARQASGTCSSAHIRGATPIIVGQARGAEGISGTSGGDGGVGRREATVALVVPAVSAAARCAVSRTGNAAAAVRNAARKGMGVAVRRIARAWPEPLRKWSTPAHVGVLSLRS